MKKNVFLVVMLGMLLAFGLVFMGCDGGGSSTGGGSETGDGNDTIWKTADITNSGFDGDSFNGIAYGSGKFVAVGGGYSNKGKIAYSVDGISWTVIKAFPTNYAGDANFLFGFFDVTYGGGKFVAVGSHNHNGMGLRGAAYSADGISWEMSSVADTGADSLGSNYNGVAYGNGMFVAVGDTGANFKVSYSANGTSWATANTTGSGFYLDMSDVVYGGGKFVAKSRGIRMGYSSDGISWTSVDGGVSGAIAYGDSKFVAVGGATYYSIDGISWTEIAEGTIVSSINDIIYGDGKFVAVGSSNKIAYWITP